MIDTMKKCVFTVLVVLLATILGAQVISCEDSEVHARTTGCWVKPAKAPKNKALSTANKKAIKAYKKKIRRLRASCTDFVQYSFADVTGDGVKELLIGYYDTVAAENWAQSYVFDIYSYKNRKVKYLLGSGQRYTNDVIACNKKRIVLHGGGYGEEWYQYFVRKKGKYKRLGIYMWESYAYGASKENDGAWPSYYLDKVSGYVSKKKFKKSINMSTKGKKIDFNKKSKTLKCFMSLNNITVYHMSNLACKSFKIKRKKLCIRFNTSSSLYKLRLGEDWSKAKTIKKRKLSIKLDSACIYTENNAGQSDREADRIISQKKYMKTLKDEYGHGIMVYVMNGKVIRINACYS